MAQHGLDRIIFQAITGKLADASGVDTTKQRLDSVHNKSNMQRQLSSNSGVLFQFSSIYDVIPVKTLLAPKQMQIHSPDKT